ncbi:MAG: hypothetical protein V8R30_05170 [Clostridia bacterium]
MELLTLKIWVHTLNFDSIFDEIRTNYNAVLEELQQSLADVKDGSDYLLNP